MELKEYQKKTLREIKAYLEWLLKAKDEALRRSKTLSQEFADETFDFPKVAWKRVSSKPYYPKKNGLGEDLPNFYLKVPTGGGKTVLACHAIDKRVVGPSFKEIAAKYRSVKEADDKLEKKIRAGGSGVWGQVPMPPNTTVSEKEAKILVKWVLSQK